MRFGVCTGLENAGVLASMGFDYVEVHTCNMMSMDEKAFADYFRNRSCRWIDHDFV